MAQSAYLFISQKRKRRNNFLLEKGFELPTPLITKDIQSTAFYTDEVFCLNLPGKGLEFIETEVKRFSTPSFNLKPPCPEVGRSVPRKPRP